MNPFKFLKFIFFGALFFLVAGFGMMYLWNALVPDLFHGPVISFWQGIGLLVLSKILFGGFRGGMCGHRCGWGGRGKYWRARWEEKLAHLSPEEREKLKENLKDCRNW